MNGLSVKYPTEEEIPTKFNIKRRCLANFTLAYNGAIHCNNSTELCTCVCFMIKSVSSEFHTSVKTALAAIEGIKPAARFNRRYLLNCVPIYDRYYEHSRDFQFDWPTILLYFSCCILILFKKFADEENYYTFMTNTIRELREMAKCDPNATLAIPFSFEKARTIRTMLGASSMLCKDAICFLLKYMNCENSGIGSVCRYLGNSLAWIDMQHLILMNDF
jgi:hypothetical protein